jgi:hypothetical protein
MSQRAELASVFWAQVLPHNITAAARTIHPLPWMKPLRLGLQFRSRFVLLLAERILFSK